MVEDADAANTPNLSLQSECNFVLKSGVQHSSPTKFASAAKAETHVSVPNTLYHEVTIERAKQAERPMLLANLPCNILSTPAWVADGRTDA